VISEKMSFQLNNSLLLGIAWSEDEVTFFEKEASINSIKGKCLV